MSQRSGRIDEKERRAGNDAGVRPIAGGGYLLVDYYSGLATNTNSITQFRARITQQRLATFPRLSAPRIAHAYMAATLEHPLSGRNKGARWAVPDFSLEARRPKAVSTLPVGQFNLGPPAPTPLGHPDEEKGRSLRTSARSASTSGLFASSDSANRIWAQGSGTSSSQPRLGLAPPAHIDSGVQGGGNGDDDDDDDALFESWHRDGGARALATDVAACHDFVEAPSRTPEPALAWVPSSWVTAVDKAVMNASGCIQLR